MQLIVLHTINEATTDQTRQVKYEVLSPAVVAVSSTGQVTPQAEGSTSIRIHYGTDSIDVPVDVSHFDQPAPVSFTNQILPILSKAGCNSGACHGKAEGQNGFKLSVFGYDPATDYDAIVRDSRGRRVFPASPENSLLLRKGAALTPHGGGQKLQPDSPWYRLVHRWIQEGMPSADATDDKLQQVRVEPTEFTLPARGQIQLRAIAVYSSGLELDVTHASDYQSNADTIAGVDRSGLVVTTDVPGQAAILVRYMGQVAVSRITRPRVTQDFVRPPEHNFLDTLVWNKLEHLRIPASELCSDAEFIRRVYLDSVGTLPQPAEVRQFLADTDPNKRNTLIDDLLDRPEYVTYWTQRWADLLQVDKDIITPQGAVGMSRWIRRQLSQNTPYDEMVRRVLLAEGLTTAESPAAFFQVQSDAEKSARAVSQLFLGVRIECAQCHHHPFERWDQSDYFSFGGFFTAIDRRPAPGGALKIVDKPSADLLKHPRTGEFLPPAGLAAAPLPESSGTERRKALAEWVTSPENPWFTRTIVNRMVAHYLGRGLVEPVDDLRATNPASNEELLSALAQHFQQINFDLRALTRTLLQSRTYQLSSQTLTANEQDEQNYSHALWKPIPAEVLLDAVSQSTAIPEQFNGWPEGVRAIEIWDNKLPSVFMEVFGRPTRQTVCACERGTEPSIAQALHLMNSSSTTRKLEDRRGRAAQLAASDLTPDQIIDELFLATLSRFPQDKERELYRTAFAETSDRRQATEDVLWTLLNSREFVFNH